MVPFAVFAGKEASMKLSARTCMLIQKGLMIFLLDQSKLMQITVLLTIILFRIINMKFCGYSFTNFVITVFMIAIRAE